MLRLLVDQRIEFKMKYEKDWSLDIVKLWCEVEIKLEIFLLSRFMLFFTTFILRKEIVS